MKIKQFIDITQEIEVDVSLEDIFEYLHTMPNEIEGFWTIDAINTAHGILRRVPGSAILAMGTDRRKLIYDALMEQAKRFETVEDISDEK